jgi:hypothetical protein
MLRYQARSLQPRSRSQAFTSTTLASGFVADYYIGPAGSCSDVANGLTEGTAWCIASINSKGTTYDGTNVKMLCGTYNIPVSNTGGTPYWNIDGGTEGDPTVIFSDDRCAIITGHVNGTATRSQQAIFGTTSGWVEIHGLEITYAERGIVQILASNVTIEDSEIHDVFWSGSGDNTDCIRAEGGTGVGERIDGLVVRNNYIHDCLNGSQTVASSAPNAAGIKLYNVEGTVVEFNTFDTLYTSVFEKSNSAATIVRYNFANGARSLTQGLGSNYANGTWQGTPANYTGEIHHNIVLNAEKFHDTGDGEYAQIVNEYNNTYYGSFSGGTYVQTFRAAGSDSNTRNSKNNIWHLTSSSGGGLVYDPDGSAISVLNGATSNYNNYPGTLRWMSGTYTTITNWRNACGCDQLATTSSPGFANAGGTTPADYVTSNLLTAGDDGGPVGAWDTGVTQIGIDWTP